MLNDWSARDIQQWEYVPLGPFQGKAFATSIGAWVVTSEALEPFRVEGPRQEPNRSTTCARAARTITTSRSKSTSRRRAGARRTISRSNFRNMYWSTAQQIAHHASSGCAMSIGDLIGSGTVSGPAPDQRGSLLETQLERHNTVYAAERRDPDVSRRRRHAGDARPLQRDGYRIGFGEVEGPVLPAK